MFNRVDDWISLLVLFDDTVWLARIWLVFWLALAGTVAELSSVNCSESFLLLISLAVDVLFCLFLGGPIECNYCLIQAEINMKTNSVAANIKHSPKYFSCGEQHEIWHTYLSDNTVSKIIIGHRDFRHFQDGFR